MDAETVIELLKGYFQDNEFDPIYMEEGDTFNFNIKFKCIEGVMFILENLELPEEQKDLNNPRDNINVTLPR